ncbi:MAG: SMC-Scp complex subunit ScpB [Candidatus Hydrothermarchaeales archaeon]
MNDEQQLVEAALFVSNDPISVEELSRILGLKKGKVKKIIDGLIKGYEEKESALEIRRIGKDQYFMQARDAFAAPLIDLVKPAVSQDVLKTLSLVALRQPITQAEVIKARGYVGYVHVKALLNKEFLSAEPKGRTKLLSTTQKFADYFGLSNDLVELKKRMGKMLGEDSS